MGPRDSIVLEPETSTVTIIFPKFCPPAEPLCEQIHHKASIEDFIAARTGEPVEAVPAADPPMLAETGADPLALLPLAIAMVCVGRWLVRVGSRRKRSEAL